MLTTTAAGLVGAAAGYTFGTRALRALARERDGARAEAEQLRGVLTRAEEALKDLRAQLDAARSDAARAGAELDLRERSKLRDEVRAELHELVAAARAEAEALRSDAHASAERTLRAAAMARDEATARDAQLDRREATLASKDETLTRREGELLRREGELLARERVLTQREVAAHKLEDERTQALAAQREGERRALERVASMSADEAKKRLLDELLEGARAAAAREAKQIEDLARDEAERRAKRIVGIALQRYAGEYASERAVTTVHLPNDELKGRIIGREGRNIRAFQEATGCDLVVDDTPETIVVSAFDPLKRETARLALEKLIADGRIHPTKIEEFVAKARDEVDRAVREAADAAALELGLGRVHPELLRLAGALRFRYSYAQNVLRHSVEVGYIAGLMAAELGLNVRQARRAGFLHDIGKAVTHEVEGGHAVIGGQFARKYGEDEAVANAIAAHHEDEPAQGVLAHLVMAADAISGARPGARREMLESYVKRLEDLEKICTGFAGVEKSFAMQAGREVRVFVEPSEVDDAKAAMLSRDIARRIESELAYPGQIRVTVVRETRAVDYAR